MFMRRQIPPRIYQQQPRNHFNASHRFHQPYAPQHSKGLLETLANKGVHTLSNVQSVLNAVETTAPIIQKYGPMIKNVPKMYQMLKAITSDNEKKSDLKVSQQNERTDKQHEKDAPSLPKKQKEDNGSSTPKLYIS